MTRDERAERYQHMYASVINPPSRSQDYANGWDAAIDEVDKMFPLMMPNETPDSVLEILDSLRNKIKSLKERA